jgi:hypothetical protein
VPATRAITERRAGTRRMTRPTASIALIARPVWNRRSPISRNIGIGVNAKFVTEFTMLRASCIMPASPPRKK